MESRTSEQHGRHALRLSQFTVAYNVLEGIVSIAFAVLAGSSALLGFGVDSFVESFSGAVMIWRFSASGLSAEQIQRREQTAARLVGIAVLMLVAYIGYESTTQLWFREKPDASPAGVAIAIASLLVMPTLFVLKRRAALALSSRSLLADAGQTLDCMLLSVALLVGLGTELPAWLVAGRPDCQAGDRHLSRPRRLPGSDRA
jgi:divalent metal cation (Fe/Co/Zn/Cd) transporter